MSVTITVSKYEKIKKIEQEILKYREILFQQPDSESQSHLIALIRGRAVKVEDLVGPAFAKELLESLCIKLQPK